MCSGGGVNHYVSGVIASMLHENLEDEYLDKIIKIYKVIIYMLHYSYVINVPKVYHLKQW